MKVGFIGDVHGRWQDLMEAIRFLDRKADILVQVGDFGWWPRFSNNWDGHISRLELPRPVYWIDGNHEDFDSLKSVVDWDTLKPQEVHPNLWYLPRGTIVEWGGMRFGFMGGGHSIDKARRTPGYDWFPDELPTYAEFNRLAGSESKVDVMVTHDAPTDMGDEFLYLKGDMHTVGNRQALQALKELLAPSHWISGHYHMLREREVGGCHMVILGQMNGPVEEGVAVLDTEKRELQLFSPVF